MGEKSDARQRTERLQERTFDWACVVLTTCPKRFEDEPSRVIWKQLVRAAPSASGNLDEADEASSGQDFLYRMRVVLREARESYRWLRFIRRCELDRHERVAPLESEARELSAIFATIVRNVARRLKAERAGRPGRL